jgi:NAD(P)-dependent dehydrogenase (short-subunit alcohol dehydrogenase family)
MKQVIVVTGASSGFGALAARALADAGHTVYASMRETASRNAGQVKAVQEFATTHKADLRAIELDVSSQESVDSAVRKIVEENGRLDVVVHNAGHMVFGPAEAFTPEQFAELYDVNVLSTQRVNRAALPQLRKQVNPLIHMAPVSYASKNRIVLRSFVPAKTAFSGPKRAPNPLRGQEFTILAKLEHACVGWGISGFAQMACDRVASF